MYDKLHISTPPSDLVKIGDGAIPCLYIQRDGSSARFKIFGPQPQKLAPKNSFARFFRNVFLFFLFIYLFIHFFGRGSGGEQNFGPQARA